MIDIPETQQLETIEDTENAQSLSSFPNSFVTSPRRSRWFRLFKQLFRFGIVGGLNTLVDLLVLNTLLLLLPTTNTLTLLTYNSLAYSLGAMNSFLLNKYWTFGHRHPVTLKEMIRFIITTLCSIAVSNAIIWLASNLLHPLYVSPLLWANASKVFAISGTVLVSYLGMRLWVFVRKSPSM